MRLKRREIEVAGVPAASLFDFGDSVIHSLVVALKYSGMTLPWRVVLQREVLPEWLDGVLLVPVPTTPSRLRERGYNQAAVIAQRLAELRGGRCVELLGRREGKSLVGAGREERQAEAARSYFFRATMLPPVDTLLVLVDDVLTTGSTLSACIKALQGAGYRKIRALTLCYEK